MQVLSKPYSAHGWLAVKASYPEGGECEYKVKNQGLFPLLFYTKGCITVKDWDTKEVDTVRGPGFWNKDLDNFEKSSWLLCIEPGSEVWCFDAAINNGVIPPVTPLFMAQGSTLVVEAGKKLFLCSGAVTGNGKTLEGPKSITFANPCTLTADTNTYGVWVE